MDAPTTLRISKHAYKRYQQRVGSMAFKRLHQRSQTALLCGLYKTSGSLIKLCGIWWGYTTDGSSTILTTCLGRGKEGERYWSG